MNEEQRKIFDKGFNEGKAYKGCLDRIELNRKELLAIWSSYGRVDRSEENTANYWKLLESIIKSVRSAYLEAKSMEKTLGLESEVDEAFWGFNVGRIVVYNDLKTEFTNPSPEQARIIQELKDLGKLSVDER